MKNRVIEVHGVAVNIAQQQGDDYICLTDIANAKEGDARAADIIKNWIRNRSTLEFIGTWEHLNNPNFKVVEFDHFRMQAGLPTFVLSAGQWVEKTAAIGIYVKAGRYGGTYAHKDIECKIAQALTRLFEKHRFLREQPEQKFLLYRDGLQPPDLENWLLDVQLAHGEFRTDQVALWLAELDLGPSFAEVVQAHAEFWRVQVPARHRSDPPGASNFATPRRSHSGRHRK